jgi:DNA-binding SARP family transcriptional activator
VPRLRVRLLGRFSVERDDLPLDLGGPLPRALLLVLAAAHGRTVSVGRLMDEMWDRPPATAEQAIASYVSRLRVVLEPGRGPREPSVLARHGGGYALLLAPEALDATDFRRLAGQGRSLLTEGRPAEAVPVLDRALGLWSDDLPELDELPPSVRPDAVRLAEERLEALENRLEARLQLGEHAAVVGELDTLVRENPLRERLGQQLALALYRSGRQPESLLALRRLMARLDQEHGLEPRAELRALERAVLTQDPSLEVAPPAAERPAAAAVAAGRPRRPPTPLAPMVGREALLEESLRTLDAHRLVTLTGPAGTGKTRLAVDLARRAGTPAAWVPLAELAGGGDLDACVATAVGATAPVGEGARTSLLTAVQDTALLVVMDNAEHVSSAAASCAVALLEAEPGVRVLATSRTALGIPGERVVEVAPLVTSSRHRPRQSRPPALPRAGVGGGDQLGARRGGAGRR